MSWRMRRSSGPMPSIGLIAPPSTWYSPRNSRVRSIATTSFASSTTQIVAGLRRGSRQIDAGLLLGDVAADLAEPHLLAHLDEDLGEAGHVEGLGLQDVERDALRRLRPDAGQAAELVDELLNDAFVHALAPSRSGRSRGDS